MNNKQYKYDFSVIIPVYNVEKYLEDTILSVINQTIRFDKKIQIILVNDGSIDNSEEICLKYKQKYLQNVVYIKQENKGVSSARNVGLECASGKYINFLDADDIWELDVFEKVYNYFEENYNKIDVVACRQKFFEGKEGFHKLDYKFEKNHIVDILEDYKEIQLSVSSAFIKSSVIKKYQFDNRLQYAEDATIMGQILMEKSRYGVLADAIYNYRKRTEETSAIQTREGNHSWYFNTIEYGYKTLIHQSIEKYGKVIPYIQYQIMYDIQWRINIDISLYLGEKEKSNYISSIIELLSYIDDYIILEQKYIYKEHKILALCLKYKKDIRKEFYYKDSIIYFKGLKIYSLKNKSLVKIYELSVDSKKEFIIRGKITCFLPEEDYNVFIKMRDGKKIIIKDTDNLYESNSIVGNLNNSKEFKIKIPIKCECTDLKIIFDYKSNRKKVNIVYGQLAKLSEKNDKLYFDQNNLLITQKDNKIYIEQSQKNKIKLLKEQYITYLNELDKKDIILLRKKQNRKSLMNVYIKFINDEMYVIKKMKKWNNKFLENKKWKKVQNLSLKKEIILNASIIVGKEKNVKNIFLQDEEYIKDLYKFKYI